MSSVKQTSEINLSGLVGRPGTESQVETLVTAFKRLDMASRSAVLRMAFNLGQIEAGHRGKKASSDKPREKPEFVTEVQAKKIAEHFGEGYTADVIVASEMPYDTAYAIFGAIIASPANDEAIAEQKTVLDNFLAEQAQD